ncbi:MAG: hypothetical protein EHM21_00370 [Chloroflexi bacterium]|nr:MAG: hypothetical protein EHM21_00370 [Chloroflexota bacterium]
MHKGSIFWGFVLVLLGGLLLAQNMGWIPPTVNVWSIFWSLALVAVGVSLLLRNTRARTTMVKTDTDGAPAMAPAVTHPGDAVRVPLGSARRARVRFYYGAGDLRVDGNAAPDELFSGTFNGGLDHRESQDGDELIADLRVPSGNITLMSPFDDPHSLDWTVGLNPNIPLVLEMEVGASRNLLNLRDLQVKELRLQTGASESQVELPAYAGETRVMLKSGMASVELTIPENVAASIRTRGGLASTEVDTLRFPQVEQNEYRSPDYEMAANRIDLDIETGLGSVRIR